MKQKLILAHFFSEAIDCVKHFAIDVSSGIESAPGKNDAKKMWEFVEAARGAGVASIRNTSG